MEYRQRYSKGNLKKHKSKCKKAHRKTYGICTVCLINRSEQVHHTSYRRSGDRYGINIFAVCKHCHVNVCHRADNWVVHPVDPVWKNHNTAAFTKLLQGNYKKIQKFFK